MNNLFLNKLSSGAVTNNATMTPKPKQPLSAYNLFFQVERQRILEGTDENTMSVSSEDLQAILTKHKNKPKRLHRKTHGKIGFRELAKTIASRWKQIDSESRKVFDEQASIEKEKYMTELNAWKEAVKQQEALQKPNMDPVGFMQLLQNPQMGNEQSLSRESKLQSLLMLRAYVQDEMERLSSQPDRPTQQEAVVALPQQQYWQPSTYNPTPTQETSIYAPLPITSDNCLGDAISSNMVQDVNYSGVDLFQAMNSDEMDELFL